MEKPDPGLGRSVFNRNLPVWNLGAFSLDTQGSVDRFSLIHAMGCEKLPLVAKGQIIEIRHFEFVNSSVLENRRQGIANRLSLIEIDLSLSSKAYPVSRVNLTI